MSTKVTFKAKVFAALLANEQFSSVFLSSDLLVSLPTNSA
jgi:hypothetical protein